MQASLMEANKVILKDALDHIEQRLSFWKGTIEHNEEYQRLQNISNNVSDPEQLMQAMADTAYLTDQAANGWCDMSSAFMQDHRDMLLERTRDYSYPMLLETISRLGDIDRQKVILCRLEPSLEANAELQNTVVAILGINREVDYLSGVIKDEHLRFSDHLDVFDPMQVTIAHEVDDNGASKSTVAYFDPISKRAKGFTLSNPMDEHGQRQRNDCALLLEAKAAFYGGSQHYPGRFMRSSLKERVAEVDALLHAAIEQPELYVCQNKRTSRPSAIPERIFQLERGFGEQLDRPLKYTGMSYDEFLDASSRVERKGQDQPATTHVM